MKRLIPICIAIAALAVAGCGSSKKSVSPTTSPSSTTTSTPAPAGGGGSKLHISADASQLKFNVSSLSAKAGKVTITMANPSPLSHDVSIMGNGVTQKGNIVGQGGTSTVTATLKAGTYTFYCSVDGHEAAGMKGTLTVK
jgi:plastocyanin